MNMAKWWLKCICYEVNAVEQHRLGPPTIVSRDLPRPEISPDQTLHETTPKPLFDVSDVKQLQELLEEIDKAMEAVQKPKTERNLQLPNAVKDNAKGAETVLNRLCDGVTKAPIARVTNESYQLLCNILQGVGNLHWAAVGLSMVAFVLNRIDQVGGNHTECLVLLEAMRDLGKHVVTLYPRLPEHNRKLKRATCLITEGAIMCCVHMKCGFFSRFGLASVNRDNFMTLRSQINLLYPDLNLAVSEAIHTVLLRQSSKILVPVKPEYPSNKVGLAERVSAVLEMLNSGPGIQAVVLHGMGGIGKSTLGMALQAKLPFTGHIHAKVKVGESPTDETIRTCQENILSRLSGEKIMIEDYYEGRQQLGVYLKNCTTPLVLFIDNIFRGEDLDMLLPDTVSLPEGSRMLVTSRDASVCGVLIEKGISCKPYPVPELADDQARTLLTMQVFNGLEPPACRQRQVDALLNICGGLPLALEVVGRYLRQHTSDNAWTLAIESLQQCRAVSGRKEDRLIQSLHFSYSQLAEDYQKVFLDITCLFGDTPWDWVEPIYGEKLVTLEELALVKKVDEGDGCIRLRVHDLLVALGRSIRPNTRISSDGQDYLPPLLQGDDMGDCGMIEGIFVKNCLESIHAEKLDAVHKSLRILILYDVPVLGKCCKRPQGLQLCITTTGLPYEDLSRLNELQVLIMSRESDFEFDNLRFPRHLKVLTLLEMRKLVYLPASLGELDSLHTLDLSWCEFLRKLPETFWRLQSLHSLILTGCKMLKQLPMDFGLLGFLEILDLRSCELLEELPSGFGQLSSLQKLDLCGCKSLRKLPDDFCGLGSLQVLHLGECESLEALPEGFGKLTCLQDLNLTRCRNLERLPEGFEMLSALKTLSLEHCQKLTMLPVSFGDLLSLVTLRLSNCKIQELPSSILQLRRLRSLDVSGCPLENAELLDMLKEQNCRVVCIDLEDLDDDLDEFGDFTDFESSDLESPGFDEPWDD